MKLTKLLLATTAGTMLATSLSAEPVQHEIVFVDHLEAGMVEQDVFVERATGGSDVFRTTGERADMDANVYTSAVAIPHDPANTEAVGPFPRGQALDMTLGEWLSAEGAGSYTCEAGRGHLELAFTGLIPDGVYTLWHFFMAIEPTDPFIGTFDLPVGNNDGTQSVFIADSNGNAIFDEVFADCLQLSGETLYSGLAVNYHSDGNTYGSLPGDFGENAHIQIFALLPPASES